jgi:uncharacterized protein YndB with AHSA1/START domain
MKSEVKITGKQLQITRVFDAPRSVVFAWWAEADKLRQWSGCQDARDCEVEMDFRPGGSFKQKMRISGKGDFAFTGKYDEIIVPQRISYLADFGRAVSRVCIDFFEEGERTKVVLTQDGFPDEMICQFVSQGTRESFDKLDERLAALAQVSPA